MEDITNEYTGDNIEEAAKESDALDSDAMVAAGTRVCPKSLDTLFFLRYSFALLICFLESKMVGMASLENISGHSESFN